jgi:hypothetical protein
MKQSWRAVGMTAALWLGLAASSHAVPSYDEVRSDHRSSETLLLSREGEVLQRLRTDSTVRRGPWVALADVSPALRTALVLSEDKRFYEHSGVDWAAVTAAAWGNLWNTRTRGAAPSPCSSPVCWMATGVRDRAGAAWCRRWGRPWRPRCWTGAGARTRFSRPI